MKAKIFILFTLLKVGYQYFSMNQKTMRQQYIQQQNLTQKEFEKIKEIFKIYINIKLYDKDFNLNCYEIQHLKCYELDLFYNELLIYADFLVQNQKDIKNSNYAAILIKRLSDTFNEKRSFKKLESCKYEIKEGSTINQNIDQQLKKELDNILKQQKGKGEQKQQQKEQRIEKKRTNGTSEESSQKEGGNQSLILVIVIGLSVIVISISSIIYIIKKKNKRSDVIGEDQEASTDEEDKDQEASTDDEDNNEEIKEKIRI